MYGMMYVVFRTTVYLPEDLKAALERTARAQGRSEAELIREGVRSVTDGFAGPDPTLPLFSSGELDAERTDALLDGFGEH
jgi:hypothetical protein